MIIVLTWLLTVKYHLLALVFWGSSRRYYNQDVQFSESILYLQAGLEKRATIKILSHVDAPLHSLFFIALVKGLSCKSSSESIFLADFFKLT